MTGPDSTPYQLRMFRRSLKKRQKVEQLCRHLGDLSGSACLLVTCGDNNGAMNYRLRAGGGRWTWADAEPRLRAAMEQLLGETVHTIDPAHLPFEDGAFDVGVAIDIHEHLADPAPFTAELARVVRPGGRVIVTAPGGDPKRLATRLKRRLGMTPEVYGHARWGFEAEELAALARTAGLEPVGTSNYSRFFTELAELAINLVYVKVLRKDGGPGPREHAIAPASQEELGRVSASYRLYTALYPLFRLVSALDALLWFRRGYANVLESRKPAAAAGD
ncbi:MAG: methyltransferase domain-containing protein [Planctomycetes bacterium]|nr:methyltransferase domain-containing protein [Planctomycetota bacterium]